MTAGKVTKTRGRQGCGRSRNLPPDALQFPCTTAYPGQEPWKWLDPACAQVARDHRGAGAQA